MLWQGVGDLVSSYASQATPELRTLSIEENEGGRGNDGILARQPSASRILHIQTQDEQLTGMITLDPIHDGLCCNAAHSIRGLEFE